MFLLRCSRSHIRTTTTRSNRKAISICCTAICGIARMTHPSAQYFFADDAGARIVALDPQESGAAFQSAGHLQSDQGASHAARAASASELLRFPHACGVFLTALVAERRFPRAGEAARASTGVPPTRPECRYEPDMSDWVLLRGLTRETRHWGTFEATMRAYGLVGTQDRVVFIDLPGNGEEYAQAAPLSVDAIRARTRYRAECRDAVPRDCDVARLDGRDRVGAGVSGRDQTSRAHQHERVPMRGCRNACAYRHGRCSCASRRHGRDPSNASK